MSDKHTGEPWATTKGAKVARIYGRGAEKLSFAVAVLDSNGGQYEKPPPFSQIHIANAERIVACVNGCAGINPEAVPDALKALADLIGWAEQADVDFEAERGSCRSLPQIELDGDLAEEIVAARAAIAKAKEGQGG